MLSRRAEVGVLQLTGEPSDFASREAFRFDHLPLEILHFYSHILLISDVRDAHFLLSKTLSWFFLFVCLISVYSHESYMMLALSLYIYMLKPLFWYSISSLEAIELHSTPTFPIT